MVILCRRRLVIRAALALCLALACVPGGAQAAEAPSAVQAQQKVQRERVRLKPLKRAYRGVEVGRDWLLQVRLGGITVGMSLRTGLDEPVTFVEYLGPATGGEGVRLTLVASCAPEQMMLRTDQHALDVLTRVGIREIVIAGSDKAILGAYGVDELRTAREALALEDGALLCVCGRDEPVSVVGEDGIRRLIAP